MKNQRKEKPCFGIRVSGSVQCKENTAKILVRQIIITLLLNLFAVHSVISDVNLPGIFGDNMVLQCGMKLPVWGTADPGERVTVTINGNSAGTKTEEDGHWMVGMKKMEVGGPYEMNVRGNNTITFTNVMVGEVWVCSGQSNMQLAVRALKDIDDEVASADYPDIRLFTVDRVSKETPQFDFSGKRPEWILCSPETVLDFSAVAFFFGRELHEELDVPIGLINSSWGGSIAEAWTRFEILESDPELKPIVDNLDSVIAAYPKAKELYDKRIAEQQKARAEGKPVKEYILPPRGPGERDYPSGLYNAMIAPMIPYGIKGAIWYQGESNSVRAYQYRTLFPAMIRDWRKAWKQGNFPFLFVQLANWETDNVAVQGGWGSWPELREAQLMTLSVPKTAMAVIIDIGDESNIHPNNKWDVGNRLALGALHVAYGRDVIYSGPIYKSMKRKGNSIRLRFEHAADGLVTGDGGTLKGFTITGKDRVFYPAAARIESDEVIVTSNKVSEPVAVRYGWDDNPECNLFNSAGLPASPFRTDNWTGITEGKLKP